MTRRFIAGAVCPRCGKMDKLLIDSDSQQRECVSCGFSDARPTETPGELKTRVSRPAARRVDTPAEAITILPAAEEDDSKPG